ncbi:MAG: hypothetical protein LC115_09840, partial [Bacteroidia bacterium]|nr:hypothetical protein [Bacteroidia bacterium]
MLSPLELHEKLRSEKLNSAESEWLQEQARKYPYFPLLRVLLAKQAIKEDSQALTNHSGVKLAFLFTPNPSFLNLSLSETSAPLPPITHKSQPQTIEKINQPAEDEIILPISSYPDYVPVSNLEDPVYPVVSEKMDAIFEGSFQARFNIVEDIFTQIRSHLKKQDDPRRMSSNKVFEDLASFDAAETSSNNTFSRFVPLDTDKESRYSHQNTKIPSTEISDNQIRLEKAREELFNKTKKLEELSSKLQVTPEIEPDESSIVVIHKNEISTPSKKDVITDNQPLVEKEKRIISESMKRFINPEFETRKPTPENNFLKESDNQENTKKTPLITSVKYSKEQSDITNTSEEKIDKLSTHNQPIAESNLSEIVEIHTEQILPETQIPLESEIVIQQSIAEDQHTIISETPQRIQTDSMKRFVEPEFEHRKQKTILPPEEISKTEPLISQITTNPPADNPPLNTITTSLESETNLDSANKTVVPSPDQKRVSTDSMKRFVEPVFDSKDKNKTAKINDTSDALPEQKTKTPIQPENTEIEKSVAIDSSISVSNEAESNQSTSLKESPSFDRFAPPEFENRRIKRPDYDHFNAIETQTTSPDTFEIIRDNLKIRIHVSNEQLATLFEKVNLLSAEATKQTPLIEEAQTLPPTVEDRLAFAFDIGAELQQTAKELAKQEQEEKQKAEKEAENQRIIQAEQERIQREL